MKGSFITCNTWNSLRVNNVEISLPSLEKKEYKLVESKLENLDFSYNDFMFSRELEEKLENFKNLDLQFIAKNGEKVKEVYSLELNAENNLLVDAIKVKAEENSEVSLVLDYFSCENCEGFRNSSIIIEAEENSNVKLMVSQRFSLNVTTVQSVYINARKGANVEVVQVDLGGKENFVSYRTDLCDREANININSIYFGEKKQILDYNYICNHIGKHSNSNLLVKGALADEVKKLCKATIDFKRGSSESKGAEEEYVTLLSDTVKNVAVPVLLCTEDDVEGLHAASAGKIDENILFYIMSRGFDMSSAKKLILESQYAEIIDLIDDEKTKEEIHFTLSKKLAEV